MMPLGIWAGGLFGAALMFVGRPLLAYGPTTTVKATALEARSGKGWARTVDGEELNYPRESRFVRTEFGDLLWLKKSSVSGKVLEIRLLGIGPIEPGLPPLAVEERKRRTELIGTKMWKEDFQLWKLAFAGVSFVPIFFFSRRRALLEREEEVQLVMSWFAGAVCFVPVWLLGAPNWVAVVVAFGGLFGGLYLRTLFLR